MVTRS
ncbi:hypothetical protein EYF80_063923 [Liparis tanakae]